MFLSGALDDTPKPKPAPPPMPKYEGPAWGGAKFIQGQTSLRDIQNEQKKTIETVPISSKSRPEDPPEPTNSGKILLSSFLPNIEIPINILPERGVPLSEGEKGTPPWSSSGTSPGQNRPSLRDIQMQQVRSLY